MTLSSEATNSPPSPPSGKRVPDFLLITALSSALACGVMFSVLAFTGKLQRPDNVSSADELRQLRNRLDKLDRELKALREVRANSRPEEIPGSPLWRAVDGGELARLEALLKEGQPVNTRSPSGETLLMRAAAKGHSGMVRVLLQFKADPLERDQAGRTVLMKAAEYGHLSAVDEILARGPGHEPERQTTVEELDWQDANGHSALMLAAAKGQRAVVQRLLATKAKTDLQDRRGRTALLLALDVSDDLPRQLDVARALVKASASSGLRDDQGRDALMLAAAIGDVPLVAEMVQDSISKAPDKQGRTHLSYAIRNGHVKVVQHLCGNIDSARAWHPHRHEGTDSLGRTDTMAALDDGRLDMFDMLWGNIRWPDWFHRQDAEGRTALMIACERGYVEIVKHILPDPPAKGALLDEDHQQRLIEHRAYINKQLDLTNKKGQTARAIAEAKGQKDIVNLITQAAKGANP